MNTRLSEFIQYKTNGHQADFASLLGWSPQYLGKLLRGENFGIRPVMALLEKFPELNARWLMLGEGNMLLENHAANVLKERLLKMLEIEKYIPVMTSDELRKLTEENDLDFSSECFDKWEKLLVDKNKMICKQKIAKK